jgi:hypothetical protein
MPVTSVMDGSVSSEESDRFEAPFFMHIACFPALLVSTCIHIIFLNFSLYRIQWGSIQRVHVLLFYFVDPVLPQWYL